MKHPYKRVTLLWRDPYGLDETTLEEVNRIASFTRDCVTCAWLVRECPDGVVVAAEYDTRDATILRGAWVVPRSAIVDIEGGRKPKSEPKKETE